jgi:hypothetical protein
MLCIRTLHNKVIRKITYELKKLVMYKNIRRIRFKKIKRYNPNTHKHPQQTNTIKKHYNSI